MPGKPADQTPTLVTGMRIDPPIAAPLPAPAVSPVPAVSPAPAVPPPPVKAAQAAAAARAPKPAARTISRNQVIYLSAALVVILLLIGAVALFFSRIKTLAVVLFGPTETVVYTIQDTGPNDPITSVNSIKANGKDNQELYGDSSGLRLAQNYYGFFNFSSDAVNLPFLSPDRKKLALATSSASEMVLLPLDGGSANILKTSSENANFLFSGGFSPNGKYFTYAQNSGSNNIDLIVVDAQGSEIQNLPGTFRAQFLSNGTQMVIEQVESNSSSANQTCSIATANVTSGEVDSTLADMNCSTGNGMLNGFFLSKNGSQIFFADSSGISRVSTKGGEITTVFESKGAVGGLALNDGVTLLVFDVAQASGTSSIDMYLVNPNKKTKTRIDKYLSNSEYMRRYGVLPVVFSPNKRLMAYTTDNGNGSFDLNVVGTNGQGKIRLTNGAGWYDFAFSPDNKKIAYIEGSNTSESGTLYIADVNGKNRIRIDDSVWSFEFIQGGAGFVYTIVEDMVRSRPTSTVMRAGADGKNKKVVLEAQDGLFTLLPTLR
jgi:dipeptidyl aminopeptidase/acylaminoacyl peptidase